MTLEVHLGKSLGSDVGDVVFCRAVPRSHNAICKALSKSVVVIADVTKLIRTGGTSRSSEAGLIVLVHRGRRLRVTALLQDVPHDTDQTNTFTSCSKLCFFS
jgi:hypothetical protein